MKKQKNLDGGIKIPGNVSFVIFDLDGTLADFPIDYLPIRSELDNYFKRYNKSSSFKPLIDEIRRLAGEIQAQMKIPARAIIGKSFDIIDNYELQCVDKCKLKHGVIRLYKKCLDGQKVAIITRNGRKMVLKFLKHAKLSLPHLICSRDECVKLKPNYEQFECVHKSFGGKLGDYALVGDSWHDEELAKKAGIRFYKVD